MPPRRSLPQLPALLDRKIYKTGQTRGADDDEIFQNRVGRNSTVLIPYGVWDIGSSPPHGEDAFEKGFIALVSPLHYFTTPEITEELAHAGLTISNNALVFYETRLHWNKYNPDSMGWVAATSRIAPLGGHYVARIPATTAIDNGERIIRGFTGTSIKGAGIRIYEYASSAVVAKCRLQLEALFWLCIDSEIVAIHNGMSAGDAGIRKRGIFEECERQGLLNKAEMIGARILDKNCNTICPLCLEKLSSQGFFNRMAQAVGREVNDLTVTQLNLFHIKELRVGVFNHCPYNLGWGHHHCNVVVKDSGIQGTLDWMVTVIERNVDEGYFATANNGN